MGRLQTIENAIKEINEAVFQNLCDSYLAIRNSNYSAFSRTGSQSGKQKTIPGTPDSFILLPNGKYLLIEHSTNVTEGISKITKDIQKCLDTNKTGIPLDQISEIIICLNFNLSTKDVQKIKKLIEDTRIRLTIVTLDSLALELHLNHRDLAHEYLKLPLDTGQIVSIQQFIKEYNKSGTGIATPLDNHFVNRKSEEELIKNSITFSDFVIITGPPGVGKTKLALEVIKEIVDENSDFSAYCVSYKSHTLLNDLYQYFDDDGKYILFVDDANRIDAFGQITGFYKSQDVGKFKIVVTVRDYAFQEIGMLCQEFSPKRIDIQKLTDEQIIDIIKAEPFKILNPDYHDPIKEIADGNPRLAIMISLLAKEKQDPNALRDVSDLFEKYYSTFVKDETDFANDLNIQILGMISFFYTVPYKDRSTTESILKIFQLDYSSFIDAIDVLDKLELVEIQFDHVKVPEQNLATYFFYCAFIRDELLSFSELLNSFFDSNQSRFKDCVIPANNTFGYEKVMGKLRPSLSSYWKNIKSDRERATKFLSIFWFYMQSETLDFVNSEIAEYPIDINTKYEVSYELNQFSFNRSELLELLGDFFRFSQTMRDAIELAFELSRKKPEYLPELIYTIREKLTFDKDDWNEGFVRQTILLDFLIQGINNNDELLTLSFYELSKSFMSFQFHHTKGGRNHTMVMYQFPLPNTQEIRQFRTTIWETVKTNFVSHEKLSLEFMEEYGGIRPDVVIDIMQFDLPYVIQIIEEKLDVESFDHCRYVQNQIKWFKENGISHQKFNKLRTEFRNSLYEKYLILNWDRFQDKESFEFEDYKEYDKLKEDQIRSSIQLQNENDVKKFYDDYVFIKSKSKNDWSYNNVLGIVIDETFKNNSDLGFYLLRLIIDKGNNIDFDPHRLFQNIIQNDHDAERILRMVDQKEFKYHDQWAMTFFFSVPDHLIKREYLDKIIEVIKLTKDSVLIDFGRLVRYIQFDSQFFSKIIKIIYEKNHSENMRITVWIDLFTKHFNNLGDDLSLVKKFYIQQNKLQNHFDYRAEGLYNLLTLDSNFLIDYIESLYSEKRHDFGGTNQNLSCIWRLDNISKLLPRVFEIVNDRLWFFGISEHFCNVFFKNLRDEYQLKADEFLLDYVRQNYSEPKKMNIVVDIVRRSRKEIFNQVLLLYLSLNQNVEDFGQIWWRGNGGTYSGNVIIGDIEAADWRNILSIVEKSNLGVKLLPVRNHIKDRVEGALRSGDWERKRRFLERF